jgi:DNA-directed RNA polymerase II subunit RPB1
MQSIRLSMPDMGKTVNPTDKTKVDRVSRYTQETVLGLTRKCIEMLPKTTVSGACVTIMKHEELMKLKVCLCNVPETRGMGTPNDPRLGTIDEGQLCFTCKQGPMTCVGHLGAIELNRWFLHPKFAETAVRILMSVCNSCGTLLTSNKILKRMGILELPLAARIKAISMIACKIGRCSCNPVDEAGIVRQCIPNPAYFPSKCRDSYNIMCEYNDPQVKGKKINTERGIEEIFEIFNRIPKASLEGLGFNGKTHPRDFVMRSLPVIPPCAIPYIVREGEISHDYITSCYCDIIRCNNLVGQKLLEDSETVEVERRKAVRNLHFYISHMMDNTDSKYTRSRDEPILSIVQRITDKEGLIRGSSMGKRVDFSGRSVLNPYNKLPFGYVAYPSKMKKLHTTPVHVSEFNLDIIREMYQNDQIISLEKGTGQMTGCRFRITENTKFRYCPEVGDEVERVGMNGDETLFNRQPTLDKLSIMGYKALYIDDPTYMCVGLHSSYTTPHNADFDGDEGNVHKIQSLDARAEVRYIASVESCIMNPKANKPTMGLVYNTTTAGYLLTQPDTVIEPKFFLRALDLLSNQDHIPSLESRLKKHNVGNNSGKALFSSLLPEDFYYTSGKVKIRDGVLVNGVITSKHLGPVEGALVHILWKQYGKERTSRFFTEAQWILDWFLEYQGFSVGYSSSIPSNQRQIDSIIKAEVENARMQITALGPKTDEMTVIEKDIHEKKVISCLSAVSRIGNRISLEALDDRNPLNVMCRGGAKGKETNIAQIVGCLGQQFVMGARPLTEYNKVKPVLFLISNLIRMTLKRMVSFPNPFLLDRNHQDLFTT